MGLLGFFPAYSALGEPPSATAKQKSGARISLIPIGDAPTPIFEFLPGGKTLLKEPAESESPPQLLYYKDGGKFTSLNLGLNSPAATVWYDGGLDLTLYASTQPMAAPFVKVVLPQTKEDMAVFMIRNPGTKNWRMSPIVRVHENGLKMFPKNSLRILNFSKAPVTITVMDGDPMVVSAFAPEPVAAHLVALPPAEQGILRYKVTARGEREPIVLAETATTYPADARINLVTYDVDGDDKTHAVKVVVYFELPSRDTPLPPGKNDKDAAKQPVKR